MALTFCTDIFCQITLNLKFIIVLVAIFMNLISWQTTITDIHKHPVFTYDITPLDHSHRNIYKAVCLYLGLYCEVDLTMVANEVNKFLQKNSLFIDFKLSFSFSRSLK
jgi:hypothetical protein